MIRILPFVCFVYFVVSLAPACLAQVPAFAVKTINAEAEYPACGVIDVNHDGKLDIVSGGFWYEAPEWKKHFLREVEVIRGRFDDYSNLELDVNADGWTDIVSVNYRSKSLFWVEHPGEKIKADPETPWTKHLIDTPGPMETGRLHDIDGDGKLDILPNGTDFAAWYELVQEKGADDKVAPRFVKHDLPKEIAGHGVGFGDINGDGRGDIVGPKGWLEAPEDRRSGRWLWHPDWELSKDASIPILVHDVDADGDNDLIWGRGHRYGLYWLENTNSTRQRGSAPAWTRHAIDTSWAQPHSLLLADLDGDMQPELIAGKRYMGHEGKDPGEYERIEHHAYSFDQKTRSFHDATIAIQCAGFGLDPKVADIDGDGDLDLIAADRNGLSLLLHEGDLFADLDSALRGEGNSKSAVVKELVQELTGPTPPRLDRFQLLIPVAKEGADIATPAQWAHRRERIIHGMTEVMGPLPRPSRRVPLDVQIESREEMPGYDRIKLTYAAEPGDRVPALLLVPHGADKAKDGEKKWPAMLCLHPTNADGKAQTAGLVGEPTRHYGHQLAQRGYVCLIPDYPSFGDYKDYDFHKSFKVLDRDVPLYDSGTMKAIWNNIRAVDLLESLGYVDPDNIGTIGHSLGGHNALFTAVFEPRLKCVVTSCGFTAFHDYYKGDLKGWTSDRYMPRIRDVYENNPDKMPFDFPEVLAAIAPRGIYVAAPEMDGNFEVSGVRKCIAAAQPVFDLLGGKDQLVVEYPNCGHDFPDDVRERVFQWLEKQLR